MGTISVNLPSDGSTADVADYNNPINTITREFNGNIDNDNIKDNAGIDGAKLADSSVTDAKRGDSGWVTISYASGFTNPGFGYAPSYRKIGSTVYLRGVVSKSSGNYALSDMPVTLPTAIRRSQVTYFIAKSNGSNATVGQINTDGTVQYSGSVNGGSITYISLDGISFMLD